MKVVVGYFGVGHWWCVDRYSVAIRVHHVWRDVTILGPLLLQVGQRFDENYRHVYVDLAVSIALCCVNGLMAADRRFRPCHCRAKYVNLMLLPYTPPFSSAFKSLIHLFYHFSFLSLLFFPH